VPVAGPIAAPRCWATRTRTHQQRGCDDYGSVTGAVTNNGTVAAANAIPAFGAGPNGTFTINGSLLNSGVVNLAADIGNQLVVVGNYVGVNGVLNVNTVLAGDGSPSDRLVISGGTGTGSTSIIVNNAGGAGALTTGDGFLLVQAINGATTTTTAFHLGAPVAAGAFDYFLFKGAVCRPDRRKAGSCATPLSLRRRDRGSLRRQSQR